MRAKKLTKIEVAEVEMFRKIAFNLSAKQQFRLAFLIAENIGYVISPARPLAEWSSSESERINPFDHQSIGSKNARTEG